MPASKPISLYQCNNCASQMFEDQIGKGLGCSACGGRYVRQAPPTFKYIAGFFLHNPRMLLAYLRENVLGGEKLIQDA